MLAIDLSKITDPVVRRRVEKCNTDYHVAADNFRYKCNSCNPNRNMSSDFAYECYKNSDVEKSCRKYVNKQFTKFGIPDPMDHVTAIKYARKKSKKCLSLANSKMSGRQKITSYVSNTSNPFRRNNPWDRAKKIKFPRNFGGLKSKKKHKSKKRKSRKKSKRKSRKSKRRSRKKIK
jgi:hypothetical protein